MSTLTSCLALIALVAMLCILPSAAFAANPHVPASVTASSCPQCHDPHQAAVGENILRSVAPVEGDLDAVKFCYSCHDGSAAVNVKTGMNNAAFDGRSGHSLEATGGAQADLTDACADCHDPHADSTTRFRLAEETITVTLPDNSTVDRSVSGADNTWCLACHDTQHSWWVSVDRGTRSTAEYDGLIAQPSRNATGYPLAGTFPGEIAYSASAHAAIPATGVTDWVMTSREATRVAGDCLWCHSAHRGVNEHDGLVAEFSGSSADDATDGAHPGRYAQACFECHGNSSGHVYQPAAEFGNAYWQGTAGAADIYSRVTAATQSAGHRIKTASGALYEQGSPLPCYECHNPHGSKNGNTVMISDALGGNLDPRGSVEQVRQFCFSCHTTGDTGAGWDSDANGDGVHTDGAYTTVLSDTAIGAKVVGISRTGTQPLQLPLMDGHKEGDTTQSCVGCHGDVHSPTGGISAGGTACYECHQEYQASMDANSTATHAAYGHIVGVEGGASGDTATSYPGSAEPVYCLSCHVDHDKFYDGTAAYPAPSAANLRTGISGTVVGTNTDHEQGTTNGLCVSCHTTAVGGTTYTVSGSDYAGKAHDYQISDALKVGYGDSAFRANCTKCHTDPVGLDSPPRQDGAYQVTPHYSASESRLAQALGAAPASAVSTEENLCFACHTGTGAGPDGYGVLPRGVNMGSSPRAVAGQFALKYSHGVDDPAWSGRHTAGETQTELVAAGKHVECEDCHNPHVLGNGTLGSNNHTKGTNAIASGSPIDGAAGWTWAVGSATEWSTTGMSMAWSTDVPTEYGICLKCHSFKNTGLTTWNATWSDVALEFNTKNDSYHPVFGALPATDSGINNGSSQLPYDNRLGNQWTQGRGKTMYCSDCHGQNAATPDAMGPHGSTVPRMLVGSWPKAPGPDSVPGTADDVYYTLGGSYTDMLCVKCHPMPIGTTLATGNRVHATHNSRSNACVNCHVVRIHGGKVSRLLGDADTTDPKKATYMDVDATYGIKLTGFLKNPGGTPGDKATDKANCTATCGGSHSGTNLENW